MDKEDKVVFSKKKWITVEAKRSKGVAQKVVLETENQLDTKRSSSEESLYWYDGKYGDLLKVKS